VRGIKSHEGRQESGLVCHTRKREIAENQWEKATLAEGNEEPHDLLTGGESELTAPQKKKKKQKKQRFRD